MALNLTLAAGSSKLNITNGDGMAGNPTLDVVEANLTLNNISGTLSAAKGGTGLDGSAAANGTLLIGNGSGFSLATLTGTANQVTVTNSAGGITLALPQSIATASTPTFGGLTLTGGLTGTTGTFSGNLTAQRLYLTDSTGGVTNPNLVVGSGAMQGTPSGSGGNTALGINALNVNNTGNNNTFLGSYAMPGTATQLNYATALGAAALVTTSNTIARAY